MNLTIYRRALSALIAIFVTGAGFVAPSIAQQVTGLEIYTRTDPPAAWAGSPTVDPGGWTSRGTGSTGSLSVPANGSLYFAFENTHVENNKKSMTVFFEASAANLPFLDLGSATGYTTQGTFMVSSTRACRRPFYVTNPPQFRVNAFFDPQPEWETLEVTNSDGSSISINVKNADSSCSSKSRSTGDNGVPDSRMEYSNNMFSAEGNQPSTTRITEVELFPRNVDVDLTVAQPFDALPPNEFWTSEFVFSDPNGDPRPHGGVRWVTDGPGLAVGELHNLAITMTGTADSSYVIFGFDAEFGQYQEISIDIGDTPWYEDFETHSPDQGVIQWRGWKGWDDDPAFDAPATNALANDGANSIRVDGNADIVHEFSEVDTGRWSFTAWQYIPTEFVSGGSGQFRGSHFLLLNTYNDGGPYHWSTDLQVDSVSGMMKIYHGDGLNTIDVPYETDRWAKIQILVDLDDDWTQVYYDNEFVTEYSWVGGITGGDGGVGEMRCVDLYANGSSPIYYDGLALEPLSPIFPLLGDINGDGVVNLLDVAPFIALLASGEYQTQADFNLDGVVNLLDIAPFVAALAGD